MQSIDIGLVWLLLILVVLIFIFIPVLQRRAIINRRMHLISHIERSRKTRLITLIHRQEVISFLGISISRHIDVEDSVKLLRAIRQTNHETHIELVVHTPGGIAFAALQIAMALQKHPGRVTVVVPHYAMSGGTLLALAADEVLMDPNAVLGPVDPQIPAGIATSYPASSILAALKVKNPNRDDRTLILGDVARKAMAQVENSVFELLEPRLGEEKAKRTAKKLVHSDWTHDRPITPEMAREMGLPVSTDFPEEFHGLLELYPQPTRRMATVEYIPGSEREEPGRDTGKK